MSSPKSPDMMSTAQAPGWGVVGQIGQVVESPPSVVVVGQLGQVVETLASVVVVRHSMHSGQSSVVVTVACVVVVGHTTGQVVGSASVVVVSASVGVSVVVSPSVVGHSMQTGQASVVVSGVCVVVVGAGVVGHTGHIMCVLVSVGACVVVVVVVCVVLVAPVVVVVAWGNDRMTRDRPNLSTLF